MIKKDIYEPAEMELVLFDTEDVITTSNPGDLDINNPILRAVRKNNSYSNSISMAAGGLSVCRVFLTADLTAETKT